MLAAVLTVMIALILAVMLALMLAFVKGHIGYKGTYYFHSLLIKPHYLTSPKALIMLAMMLAFDVSL